MKAPLKPVSDMSFADNLFREMFSRITCTYNTTALTYSTYYHFI